MGVSYQEPDGPEIPIDMGSHLFGKDNTWVVIGLPDTEEQYTESRRRDGVGNQFNWRDYFETVTFVEKDFPPGHPLYNARKVAPKVGEPARADQFPCYSLRRRQIDKLRALGLNVTFGATSVNFIHAAEQAFACGGLLAVLSHFEEDRGFEFTDGFLPVDDIPYRRIPSGRGLLDAVACRIGKMAPRIKLAIGPATWVYLPTVELGMSAALVHRTEFWTSVVEKPKLFLEHLQFVNKRLKILGIPTGTGRAAN